MIEPSKLFHRKAITGELSDFLIGRSDLISEIANRLAEDDVSCILYGERGVGKTTIAWQVLSIFMGTNKRFRKDETLLFKRDAKFMVALHKCSSSIKTIGDLLVNLLSDKGDEFKFQNQFSKIFNNKDVVEQIERRFGINLLRLVTYSTSAKSSSGGLEKDVRRFLGDEQSKIALFHEIISEIKRMYDVEKLVIAIDEMDRPLANGTVDAETGIEGLGDFLKDVEGVQFLFVGIGQTIQNIIYGHPSAARKIAANDIEAPLLSENEIQRIFLHAQGLSGGKLDFDESFIEAAVEYSGGIPWIAQHTGYEATLQKITQSPSTVSTLTFSASDFNLALETVIRVFKNDASHEINMQTLEEVGVTGESILWQVWRKPTGLVEDDIRQSLPVRQKRYFDQVLKKLEQGNIVNRRGKYLVFSDPALRLMVKFHLDRSNSNN